ncbi:MAG: helix-turn-helix domain-containing protein [Ktedonobacterales bacterium]
MWPCPAWTAWRSVDEGTVTVQVRRLREKVDADSSQPVHLLTARGVGYKFEDEPRTHHNGAPQALPRRHVGCSTTIG